MTEDDSPETSPCEPGTDSSDLRSLGERSLAALRQAIGLVVVASGEQQEVLEALARAVRRGVSRPGKAGVRIRSGDLEASTPQLAETPWRTRGVRPGDRGETCVEVEVVYRDEGAWRFARRDNGRDQLLVAAVADLLTYVRRTTRESDVLSERLHRAESLEAVGRLAGGVAHDFNNLLTSIQGYAELVFASLPDDDERRADMRQILTGVERAAALTSQLLAFGRGHVLQRRVLDLNRLITEARPLLDSLLRENVELRLALEPEPWPVQVDGAQLQQILVDLASNAQNAMPEGGRLEMRTSNLGAPLQALRPDDPEARGERVLLEVADTGHGMDRVTRERIFEPFFTTRELGQGRGLGLSTVYGMVEQNGGSIEVESELDEGTLFRISFPRATSAGIRERRRNERDSHAGSVRILVAEDEAPLRPLIERILTQAGYEVLMAPSAERALELFDDCGGKVDLLLTDVVMPGLAGRRLVDQLRGRLPELSVVYMSGYTDDMVMRRGLDAEEALFLAKPFSAKVLLECVRRALGEASAM